MVVTNSRDFLLKWGQEIENGQIVFLVAIWLLFFDIGISSYKPFDLVFQSRRLCFQFVHQDLNELLYSLWYIIAMLLRLDVFCRVIIGQRLDGATI